jgi:2-keto-4-pentenoate hydratase
MSDAAWQRAAGELRRAYFSGPIASVCSLMQADDADSAYAVQEINTRFWQQAGRRIVGSKIGLTSAAVQQQLGVNQPDFGVLFADMQVADGAAAETGRLLQPRAEAEVAFVMGRDLIEADASEEAVRRAVEFVLPAIEIADSRVAGWKITLADTIADNASAGIFVMGAQPRRLGEVDLGGCAMVLSRNGEPVSRGSGSACLGHPLNAVTWLARTMARRGRPLAAGDIVLSGALGPMAGVARGDHFHATIDGLGCVGIRFS